MGYSKRLVEGTCIGHFCATVVPMSVEASIPETPIPQPEFWMDGRSGIPPEQLGKIHERLTEVSRTDPVKCEQWARALRYFGVVKPPPTDIRTFEGELQSLHPVEVAAFNRCKDQAQQVEREDRREENRGRTEIWKLPVGMGIGMIMASTVCVMTLVRSVEREQKKIREAQANNTVSKQPEDMPQAEKGVLPRNFDPSFE